jgi:hypothetical protein
MLWQEVRLDLGQKPSDDCVINWAHPATLGLVACYVFNEKGGSPRDLTKTMPPLSAVGSPDWAQGLKGAGSTTLSTTNYWDTGANNTGLLPLSAPFAAICYASNYTNGSQSGAIGIGGSTAGGGWALLSLQNSGQMGITTWGAADIQGGLTAPTWGGIGVSFSAVNGTGVFGVNGQVNAKSVSGPSAATNPRFVLGTGYRAGALAGTGVTLTFAAVFNLHKIPSIMSLLTQNPGCILLDQTARKRYFGAVISAPPATGNPWNYYAQAA